MYATYFSYYGLNLNTQVSFKFWGACVRGVLLGMLVIMDLQQGFYNLPRINVRVSLGFCFLDPSRNVWVCSFKRFRAGDVRGFGLAPLSRNSRA